MSNKSTLTNKGGKAMERNKSITKKQEMKLNKLFKDDVLSIALEHSDFTDLAHEHFKQYLQETFKSPFEWASVNLSPDEIKDILKGVEVIGADFKKEVNK